MILSGDLKDFSLADVLQLLLQQRKSGVLNLVNEKEKAEVYIYQGNVNGVRVNGETPEDKIKEMLIASGKVDKEEMQQLESISRDMNRPLLATLTAKGHLTDEDKKEWLQIISEDMVCELFGWLKGNYDFATGIKAQNMMSAQLNISTEFACMEGMRRIDEWPRLHEALPNSKIVFRPLGRNYEEDRQGWDFLVFGLVDGRRNMEQIAKQVPFGSFRLSECLVNLRDGGFITPIAGTLDEIEIHAPVDPQTEKDRKTAMILGIAMVLLVFAVTLRLLVFWMQSTKEAENYKNPHWKNGESTIGDELIRDNLEALLIDYADRKDNFPNELNQLVKIGVLASHEIKLTNGTRPSFHKITEKSFQLK